VATATAPEPKTVTLSPFDLAELLGVDRADAGLLSSAPVRLPADWPAKWRARLGPLELTTAEVGMLTGRPRRTVQDWIKQYGLKARPASGGDFAVAPAALVEFFRGRSAGKVPVPVETPRQRDARGARAKAKAAEVCGRGKKS